MWFPVTPGGTVVTWLGADTEAQAWDKLLEDAAHMPYKGKEAFKARGYSMRQLPASMATLPWNGGYKFSTGPK